MLYFCIFPRFILCTLFYYGVFISSAEFDVYDILDTPSVATLSSLLKNSLAKYRTEKAQVFLKKIYNLQHQLCYAHTCTSFTAGHVSDQRMEQGMAAMKANGKLKSYLNGCTYGEAVSRISQVARDQDFTALKEL